MRLLGHYLSPFTRRVAVSLHALRIPFELEELSVIRDPERVRPHNPLLRIPTLLLDDGTALIESDAILDEIDQMAGPERALVPPAGAQRRTVMQLTAFALASMDKMQWAFYERRFRPEEKVHQPWIDHNEAQALGGLRHLDQVASGASGWLAGTERMTQADITTAVVVSFITLVRPELQGLVPNLCAFAARCEQLPVFRSAPMAASQPGRPGVWIGSGYERVAEGRTQKKPAPAVRPGREAPAVWNDTERKTHGVRGSLLGIVLAITASTAATPEPVPDLALDRGETFAVPLVELEQRVELARISPTS